MCFISACIRCSLTVTLPPDHCSLVYVENCSPPSGCSGSIVADNIRHVAHDYGCVNVFKAYSELSTFSPKMVALRSELQSSGVSLIDCPHNGKKDVADKMMIGGFIVLWRCQNVWTKQDLSVDMLTYAMDTPPPATIILITGDRDFAYAISILRWRKYNVVVIAPYTIHSSVKFGASAVLDWDHVHRLGKQSSAAPDLDSPERLLHSFDDTKDNLYSIPNHDITASTQTYNVQQLTPKEDVFNIPTKAQYSHGRSASAASEPIRPDTLRPWDTPAGVSASPYKMPAWRSPASGNVKLGVSPSWHPVMEKADLAPVNDINFYLKSRSRDASAESVSRNEVGVEQSYLGWSTYSIYIQESYFVAVEASEVASTTPTSTSASDGIATLVNVSITPSQNMKLC